MSSTIKPKLGTTDQWRSSGRVLEVNEWGVEKTAKGSYILRIGDGEHLFHELTAVFDADTFQAAMAQVETATEAANTATQTATEAATRATEAAESITSRIAQDTGDSETAVMSQKAVTEGLCQLSNEIESTHEVIGNLFGGDYDKLAPVKFADGYASPSDGSLSSVTGANGMCRTNYIKVSPGDAVKVTLAYPTQVEILCSYAMYGEDKSFNSGGYLFSTFQGTKKETTVTIPDGVEYVIFNFYRHEYTANVFDCKNESLALVVLDDYTIADGENWEE